MRNVTS